MLIDSALVDARLLQSQRHDVGAAATSFESLLLGQVFQSAAKPLFEDSLLSGGSAGRMFNEMFIQTLAEGAVRDSGLGIASLIEDAATQYEEFTRHER